MADGQIQARKTLAPYFQPKFVEKKQLAFSSSLQLTNGIPNDFPLKGLNLDFRFRMHITDPGGGAASTLNTEVPWSLIKNIQVTGNHKTRGSEVICKWYGPDLMRYNQFFGGGRKPWYYNPDTLAGAAADYDVAFRLYVPFSLQRVRPAQQLLTMLDAQNYSNLQLQVDVGAGKTDLFLTAHTMTDAFNDFEGDSGEGYCMNVTRIVGLLGADVNFKPALVKRTYIEVPLTTTMTDGIITNMPVGNSVANYAIKVGTTIASVQHATTLPTDSSTILKRARLKLNGVPIKDMDWRDHQHYCMEAYNIVQAEYPYGWGIIDFIENGDINQALKTFDFAARSKTFQLCGDVAGAANQLARIYTTEIIPANG
jgi:hypothetical protein